MIRWKCPAVVEGDRLPLVAQPMLRRIGRRLAALTGIMALVLLGFLGHAAGPFESHVVVSVDHDGDRCPGSPHEADSGHHCATAHACCVLAEFGRIMVADPTRAPTWPPDPAFTELATAPQPRPPA